MLTLGRPPVLLASEVQPQLQKSIRFGRQVRSYRGIHQGSNLRHDADYDGSSEKSATTVHLTLTRRVSEGPPMTLTRRVSEGPPNPEY
jgi:hypothetical protein